MGKNRRQAFRHGYVVIDKPAGWTSHDVVSRVRRIVGERRVGHAGTLDPAAVGVLPVAVGVATRTVEYLADASKEYRAWIRFGVTTDSADGDGTLTSRVDASHLTLEAIEAVLGGFRGPVQQRPPMHSAIKVRGKRLYQLAREGVEIEVASREITIHDLRIVEWRNPDLCIDVHCSKGTYIRSLARDLGEAVGTGAYLSHLVRTRTGPFSIADALTLDELDARIQQLGWSATAYHPDWVMQHLPALILGAQEAIDWGHGKTVPLPVELPPPSTVRAYDGAGRWLGVGEIDETGSAVRPTKVIPLE